MKIFAKLKNEIWCMNLAYVDKVAKEIIGVKCCLLVHRNLFDRTVDAKGMKTIDCEEAVGAFSTMIRNMERRKFGLRRPQKMLESL